MSTALIDQSDELSSESYSPLDKESSINAQSGAATVGAKRKEKQKFKRVNYLKMLDKIMN